jgi:hypothetical protein
VVRILRTIGVLFLGAALGGIMGATVDAVISKVETGSAIPESYADGFVLMVFLVGGSVLGLLLSLIPATFIWRSPSEPVAR